MFLIQFLGIRADFIMKIRHIICLLPIWLNQNPETNKPPIIYLFIHLDDLRLKVWPKILSCDDTIQQFRTGDEVDKIEKHQYYNQVVMDVKRILKRFPPGMFWNNDILQHFF